MSRWRLQRLTGGLCLGLALLPGFAAIGSAAEATAVFERIRSTPAQLKLHCEQLKLQGDSVDAYLRKDPAAASRMVQRINHIQSELPGYREAFAFYSGKAGDMAFYRTADGKALEKAQRALDGACAKPKFKK